MSESAVKRHFRVGPLTYTVTVDLLPDLPNRFVVRVHRANLANGTVEALPPREYDFSRFPRKLAPHEADPIKTDLLTFAEQLLSKGEKLPETLPKGWTSGS